MSLATETLMTTYDVAAYVRKPLSTIYRWNRRSSGPPYMRVGRSALYRKSDVDSWLSERYVVAGRAKRQAPR